MVISLESKIGMKGGDSFKRNRLKTSSVFLFSIRVAQWGMNELFFHQMNTNKQENKGSQRLLSKEHYSDKLWAGQGWEAVGLTNASNSESLNWYHE